MIYSFIHTTGIHFTGRTVEWAVLRKSRKGIEKLREGTVDLPEGSLDDAEETVFPAQALAEIRRNFRGILTVSLSSSQLLMKMFELPSTDPDELRDMVKHQIDGISPFPLDQMTVSYEVFQQTEDHSRVLAVAAPRKIVDSLGDRFKEQHVYIRSLDAEILAWWSLLIQHGQVRCEGRTVLILEEHTEFAFLVADDGVPVCIRSLELFHDLSDETALREIAEEISYTLLSLESEYGPRDVSAVMIWSASEIPASLCDALKKVCRADVSLHDLSAIPPLAEGLALRSAERGLHHVELIPKEWLDIQRRKRIFKAASAAALAVFAFWMAAVAVTAVVFSVRQSVFNRIRRDAEKYEAPARAAQAAREEMVSLEKYADRSRSALECLREITEVLPAGVEIASFTYKKGEAVTLRGSSERADSVYEYFRRLGESQLFTGVKDQPVSTRTVRDRRISTFSITAELPPSERENTP